MPRVVPCEERARTIVCVVSVTHPVGRVLLVDDEGAVRRSLVRILGAAGYHVVDADSGKQALDLLTRHSFDVVVTDVRMPDIDGFELLRAIRLHHPGLPVIFTTGAADEIDEKQFGVEVLAKPIDLNVLETMLRRARERNGG